MLIPLFGVAVAAWWLIRGQGAHHATEPSRDTKTPATAPPAPARSSSPMDARRSSIPLPVTPRVETSEPTMAQDVMWLPRDTALLVEALRRAHAQAGTSAQAEAARIVAATDRLRQIASAGPSSTLIQIGPVVGYLLSHGVLRRLDASRLSPSDREALRDALGGLWAGMRSRRRQDVASTIHEAVDRGDFRS